MYKRSLIRTLPSLGLCLLCATGVSHPADENPDLTLPDTTRQYRQDRLGLAIHWGVHSVLCDGGEAMREQDMPLSDYEKTAQFFNPAEFNVADWVSLAKTAGARYITFTAKSRDGFAMWDSASSDWNVVDRTPFKRDVVKELAEECRKEGIKLFLHYSPMDWHHDELTGANRQPAGATIDDSPSTATVEFTKVQLTELLTHYGKLDGVWLDGWFGKAGEDPALQSVYQLIRQKQPAALIGNNHNGDPLPGEDFDIRGWGAQSEVSTDPFADLTYNAIPSEIPDSINQSLGFDITDNEYKSVRELVHRLVRAAGLDSNYLLNIGVMPNGQVQPEFRERLIRVGMWLAKHGESIYGTRGGPVAPQPWGVTTHRGRKVYVHVLDPDVTSIQLRLPDTLLTARYFSDESDVQHEVNDGVVTLTIRPERRGELQRLLVLETKHYH